MTVWGSKPSKAATSAGLAVPLLFMQSVKSIPALLSNSNTLNVSVNGLLTGTEDEAVQRAVHLVETGYKTLKIKVGRNPIDLTNCTINQANPVIRSGIIKIIDLTMSVITVAIFKI